MKIKVTFPNFKNGDSVYQQILFLDPENKRHKEMWHCIAENHRLRGNTEVIKIIDDQEYEKVIGKSQDGFIHIFQEKRGDEYFDV